MAYLRRRPHGRPNRGGDAQWRQRGQLQHDREVRDLEELRALLDACATAISEASEAFLRWTNVLAHTDPEEPANAGERGNDDDATDREPRPRTIALSDDVTIEIEDDGDADLDELSMEFTTTTAPIFSLYQRVVLRLGVEHPVSDALRTVQTVFAQHIASTDDIEDEELGSPERWKAVTRLKPSFAPRTSRSWTSAGSRIREG
jgi:hypothetical protein